MSRTDSQMKLRLPASLKDRLEAAAHSAGRSMNAEVITRLEASFETAPQDALADLRTQADLFETRLAELRAGNERLQEWTNRTFEVLSEQFPIPKPPQ